MALDATKLQTISGGTEQQSHTYNTTDAIATVVASGYFNAATNNLRQFDFIRVAASTGGTATGDLVMVTSASKAATVTTINCT